MGIDAEKPHTEIIKSAEVPIVKGKADPIVPSAPLVDSGSLQFMGEPLLDQIKTKGFDKPELPNHSKRRPFDREATHIALGERLKQASQLPPTEWVLFEKDLFKGEDGELQTITTVINSGGSPMILGLDKLIDRAAQLAGRPKDEQERTTFRRITDVAGDEEFMGVAGWKISLRHAGFSLKMHEQIQADHELLMTKPDTLIASDSGNETQYHTALASRYEAITGQRVPRKAGFVFDSGSYFILEPLDADEIKQIEALTGNADKPTVILSTDELRGILNQGKK